MTVRDALAHISLIQVPGDAPPVVYSAAEALAARTGADVVEVETLGPAAPAGVFQIAAPALSSPRGDLSAPRIDLRLRPGGSGRLVSAGGRMLYAAACHIVEVLAGGNYKIKISENHEVLARLNGKMRQYRIRVIQGDRVTVGVSPYDLKRGLITYRAK